MGFTYAGNLRMGAAGDVLQVIYDTGSDWLTIEGDICTSCEGNKFDAGNSGVQQTTTLSERQYGSVYLKGYEYTDKVCVDSVFCVNDFRFFLIESIRASDGFNTLSEPVDGILGMSRDISLT